MVPPDKKMDSIQLPPGSEPLHRSIAQKAAENLGRLADGNGLKAAQIRLGRVETIICRIPASITVKLVTEVLKARVKGNVKQGTVVATAAEMNSAVAARTEEALRDGSIQQQISDALKKDPARGFGMDQAMILLPGPPAVFSIVSTCSSCGGGAFVTCARCGGTGNTACMACRGNGFSNCQGCHGTGQTYNNLGASTACMQCQGSGKIACHACRGNRSVVCTECQGQGRSGCRDCGRTGSFTEIYKIGHKAQCTFDIDWRDTPPEGKTAAHKLGLRVMAAKNHAEVIWLPPEARADDICISCVAFLPLANAEFLVEGRAHPARVAGLQGRIIQIDPLLDKHVKPGITALMKLSKGPMARQALIDTACKYRLIRQVLAGLTRDSKKNVYQRLCGAYPLLVSDKYARATVRYAAVALASLSTVPRYKGLALGTFLATLPAAAYYLTPLRRLLMMQMSSYIAAADVAVWLVGAGIAVYTIKATTARALRRVLPGTVAGKSTLPAAGPQGLAAFVTTALTCCLLSAIAAEKPEWVQYFRF